MSDATRDRIEGTMDEVTGHGKSAIGDLTGNDDTKAEGEMDQARGGLKKGVADIKDKVDDTVKKVTDNR